MRQAAAALLSGSPETAVTVLPILIDGRNATTGRVRQGLTMAQGTALLTLGRYEESLTIARQAMRDDPRSRAVFLAAECLFRLKRISELRTLLEQELPKVSDVRELTLLLAAIELDQGNAAQAEARIKGLVSTGRNRDEDARYLAWLSLYRPQITDNDVAEAQRVNAGRTLQNPLWLRTMAALYAETGKTAEALTMLGQSLDARSGTTPGPDDWYVLGRIYEAYGEHTAAEAAYRKALERTDLRPALDSARVLADRGLKRIETKK